MFKETVSTVSSEGGGVWKRKILLSIIIIIIISFSSSQTCRLTDECFVVKQNLHLQADQTSGAPPLRQDHITTAKDQPHPNILL